MHKSRFITVFALFLGAFLLSCKKQKTVTFSCTTYLVSSEIKLQNSFWINSNTGYACGGIRSEKGKIFKTNDGGLNWTETYSNSSKSLYDICFINDSVGYCSGESFLFLQTLDYGKTWKEYNLPLQPAYYDIVTLRNIYFNNNVMVISGGDNFNKGVVFSFLNDHFIPYFSHRDSETRAMLSFDNNISFMAFGYGYAFKSTDTVKTFKPINLTGDFYTGACTVDNTTGYTCGYDGGIYKTTDAGTSWQKQNDVNHLFKTRVHLNSIYFLSSTNGWCVGDNGVVLHTVDGTSWEKIDFKNSENLFSIRKKNSTTVMVSSSGGALYEFN